MPFDWQDEAGFCKFLDKEAILQEGTWVRESDAIDKDEECFGLEQRDNCGDDREDKVGDVDVQGRWVAMFAEDPKGEEVGDEGEMTDANPESDVASSTTCGELEDTFTARPKSRSVNSPDGLIRPTSSFPEASISIPLKLPIRSRKTSMLSRTSLVNGIYRRTRVRYASIEIRGTARE